MASPSLAELKAELADWTERRRELALEFDAAHDLLAPVWASTADFKAAILATYRTDAQGMVIARSGNMTARYKLFRRREYCEDIAGAGTLRNHWRQLCARNAHYKKKIKILMRKIERLESKPHTLQLPFGEPS